MIPCQRCNSTTWSSLSGGICNVCIATEKEEIAQKQGLMLVQLSSRRFIVVKMEGAVRETHSPVGRTKIPTHVYLGGRLVFGPETIDSCIKYIKENTKPITDY
jgi:hypothetical protein